MCPEGAEEVEDWKGDETCHRVRRGVGDGGVLGYQGTVGEHGGFGKAGGAAGRVEGCWSGGCGCCVGDGDGWRGAVRQKGEEGGFVCSLRGRYGWIVHETDGLGDGGIVQKENVVVGQLMLVSNGMHC